MHLTPFPLTPSSFPFQSYACRLVGDNMIPDGLTTTTHEQAQGQGTSNNGASDSNRDNLAITSSARNDGTSQDSISGGMTLTPSPITQVFLSQLSPGTLYVVRVKVKTVGGWSSYSMPSVPFRTPSAS